MTLRGKLLLAQLPLLAALVLVAVVAGIATASLGRGTDRILHENYRSVVAAQRMKEAAERIDSGTLFAATGRRDEGARQIAANREVFERELAVEESNITEEGESEAAGRLREAWGVYAARVDAYLAPAAAADARDVYFAELLPRFHDVKGHADSILTMNQDAMVRKSEAAKASARRLETFLGLVALLGAVLGVVASAMITTRMLRPLSVLSQTAKRVGEGDLAVRARVDGKDEIAQLAGDLNAMIGKLEAYRKSSLGELLEAQSAMQAAIDSLPNPVLVLSLDGAPLSFNQAAQQLLGVNPDAGGSAALANVPPPLMETIERVRKHVLAGKGPYAPGGLEEAVRVPSRDGDVHLLPRAAPVYSLEGAVVATTVVLQDVTRLVRSEQRHGDVVATVAHEFRTPLTSMRMAIHLCLEGAAGPLSEKQSDLLHAAREDCERLETIVSEFLQISRMLPGGDRVEVRPVEPEDLVRATAASHERAAEERKIRLVIEVTPGLPEVAADRERALVALDNLVANAIRFAPEGSDVVIRARALERAVRFEVEDKGPGVPAGYRETIFERNVRVPGSTGGAGLGLFIARENVKAHGGRIGVETEVGKGSSFWIELPLAAAA